MSKNLLKKMAKFLPLLLPIIGYFIMNIFEMDCAEEQKRDIYPRLFQGRISEKEHSHKAKAPMTELSSGTYFYSCGCAGEYLKNAKVGDSIYKPSNSYIFQIFKADTMLEIDVSCPPVE